MERQFTFVLPYAEESHLLHEPAALNAADEDFYSRRGTKKSHRQSNPAKRFLSRYCVEDMH